MKTNLILLSFLLPVINCFASKTPNIILILADDMGPGEPSHMGGIVPTPALDRMAKEGMRFTDAHTTSSVCTPTRYGILTGRYNWRSRLKRGVLGKASSKALMDPNRVNLPNFLQQNGYHTGIVGKWHLGADWELLEKPPAGPDRKDDSWRVDYSKPFRNGPVDVGFDEAFFILSSLDMAPYLYLRNNKSLSIPTVNAGWAHNEYNDFKRVGAGAADFDAHTCLADFASESREYIKRQASDKDNPFFLYVPLTSPHTPCTPGKKFKGNFPQYSLYADLVAETDWVVEQILEQVADSGIDKETLLIYTSDNGFAPYVKIPKMMAAGYKPSGDWRGSKATIFEGGHRVPFLVRWPGKVKPGTTSDVTICTTDFFATFAEILAALKSIPVNAAEDSFSFLSSLWGEKQAIRPFTIHHSIGGIFAIRKGEWKLILSKSAGGGWSKTSGATGKVVQLYNLADDPSETKNLEDSHPEKIKELVADLAEAFRNGRTTRGPVQSNEGWPFLDKKMMQHFPELAEFK